MFVSKFKHFFVLTIFSLLSVFLSGCHFLDSDQMHGPDKDQILVKPGFLNGIWRVATSDINDLPLVYLTITHDLGEVTAEGHFEMGVGANEQLVGNVGQLKKVTWVDNQLMAQFNPTNDLEQSFVVTSLEVVNSDLLRGNMKDLSGTFFNIKITRENN